MHPGFQVCGVRGWCAPYFVDEEMAAAQRCSLTPRSQQWVLFARTSCQAPSVSIPLVVVLGTTLHPSPPGRK